MGLRSEKCGILGSILGSPYLGNYHMCSSDMLPPRRDLAFLLGFDFLLGFRV